MNRLTVLILSLGILLMGHMYFPSMLTAQNVEWEPSLNLSTIVLPPIAFAPFDKFRAMSLADASTSPARSFADMGTVHKYLGFGTLLLAAGAAFSSSNEDVHKPFGYAAASAATLTCITGFMEYSDYFDPDEGWTNKYNIHIATGVAATAGFILTSILGADGDSHGGIGGGSSVLMCVPVVILKW